MSRQGYPHERKGPDACSALGWPNISSATIPEHPRDEDSCGHLDIAPNRYASRRRSPLSIGRSVALASPHTYRVLQ